MGDYTLSEAGSERGLERLDALFPWIAERRQAARARVAAMERCDKSLTGACAVGEPEERMNFSVGGIMAPISFDNSKQLSGTAIKRYQLDAKSGTFRAVTDFRQY